MRHSFSHKTKESAILFIPHKSRKTKLKNFSALEREPYVFDREIARSARGPTSGSYCCVVVRAFVLIELYDAILL